MEFVMSLVGDRAIEKSSAIMCALWAATILLAILMWAM
jgi:hypothetical protein